MVGSEISTIRGALGALLLAALLTAMATQRLIAFMRRHGYGQPIREEGNQAHLKKKGTPTMGGLVFIPVALLLSLLFSAPRWTVSDGIICVGALGFGAIGFLDDFEKIKKAENEGLTPKQKLLCQVIIASAMALLAYFFLPGASGQIIPFFKRPLDIGIFWVPILVFILIGTTNAVNLTDGLDGLATGVSLPVLFTIAFFAAFTTTTTPEISASVARQALIFAGALSGFLFFNAKPASIMMGDTGSMALGGAITAMMLSLNRTIYLALIGGVYVAETLSVILQVAYFKRSGGKRLFLMSPIHHHFELKGYAESKVSRCFALASLLLCIFTIAFA